MKFHRLLLAGTLVTLFTGSSPAISLKDITFTTKTAGKVVFSHTSHLAKEPQKNNCRACHDAIYDLKKPVRFSMADMEQGKSCGACHDGKIAFALGNCLGCHPVKDVAIKIRETGPVEFTHRDHAGRQPCSECHPKLFATGRNKPVGMAAMEHGKSCGACHNGTKAFAIDDCAKCHVVQDISFRVKQTGPVAFTHKDHARRQSCSECHPRIFSYGRMKPVGMAAMEKGRSCGACHDGRTAFSVAECAGCHPVRDLTFPVKGISDARFSHKSHLVKFRCEACHLKLYAVSRGKPVGMAAMEKGKSCGACHNGTTAFPVTASCGFCH